MTPALRATPLLTRGGAGARIGPVTHPLARLETLDGYRRHFMDAALWRLYVIAVCDRHGLAPCERVSTGLPGTCPAFAVEERWLVKFFGRLFDGGASYAAEREANRLLSRAGLIPAPAVVAAGELFPAEAAPAGWPWPYLVYEFIPGVSIGEIWAQMDDAERLSVARTLGQLARRMHALPLAGSAVFPDSWDVYVDFLAGQAAKAPQAAREWACLSERLIAQITPYVLPPSALIDPGVRPHLIHADLNGDHLLGRLEGGRWTTLGIIDFGDAMVGSLYYEVVALHLGIFRHDRRLLRAFLDAYGLSAAARRDFPAKAMTAALLHRCNVLVDVPTPSQFESLQQMAVRLWDVG